MAQLVASHHWQRASNVGPDTSESVILTDTLDANTSYVKIAAPRGWTCSESAGVVTCEIASMESGKTATFYLAVRVSRDVEPGSQLANTATLSSQTYDSNETNNTVTQTTDVKSKKK